MEKILLISNMYPSKKYKHYGVVWFKIQQVF